MTNFILPVLFVGTLGLVLTYHSWSTWAAHRVMVSEGVARMFAFIVGLGGVASAAVTAGFGWLAGLSLGTSEGWKPPLMAAVGGTIVVLVAFFIDRHFYAKNRAAANK